MAETTETLTCRVSQVASKAVGNRTFNPRCQKNAHEVPGQNKVMRGIQDRARQRLTAGIVLAAGLRVGAVFLVA